MRQVLLSLLIGFVLPLVAQTGDRNHAQANAFGNAQWIGAITKAGAKTPVGRHYSGSVLKETKAAWEQADPLSRRSIILRRSFRPYKTVRQAELRICGLGFYEASINGQKVGESEFAPTWSDYDKTVYFNTYDVTQLIRQGDNELRVLLGNGFYNEQGGRYVKLKVSFGPPTLLCLLYVTYEDGMREHLFSDSKWQWTESPITFNSIYGGEDYDARMEVGSMMPDVRAEQWKPVVIQEAPEGVLCPQLVQPVKVMERFPVKDIVRKDSVLVVDMGQNLAGYPEITVEGKAGQRLKLIPGETLTEDGLVNQRQTGRPHYYTYILKGNSQTNHKPQTSNLKPQTSEVWHPRFSYYSFRYLQIEGDINALKKVESCFVYNSAERTGSFECSNPRINATHRLIDRAIRSNWQAVWTDCPSREKLGWLEQTWLNGEALVYNYDAQKMIEQTMQNIVDAQHEDGSVPEIAPEYTQFTGSWARPFQESPEWGGAIIALPMLCLRHYGNFELAERHYDAMKRYVGYLATQDSCYILRQGLGDWYDYGPGRAGFSQNTPMPLVSTAHYYQWMCNMFVIAKVLGKKEDAERFNTQADNIRQAFNRTFYDAEKKTYGTGSQCSLALPLYLKMVPEGDYQAVLQHLIDDIKAHGTRLTTGDVGNRYLFSVLIENDQRELLYAMLNHDDVPGYGYQIKKGHTTLTEQWNPDMGASMNHFMMAHIENFLIPDLLGIQRTGDLIEIQPHPVGDIIWCKGSTMSAHGPVKVEWRIYEGVFTMDIDIPEGGFADVYMPFSNHAESVTEGRHRLTEKIR
ncbi:MAG: alpha-L-rhamnosidase [Prevotella sp.]|nr:alpha-L-rhamnosidase [Prevotella sp.]